MHHDLSHRATSASTHMLEPRCCWLRKSVNFPHWRYKRLTEQEQNWLFAKDRILSIFFCQSKNVYSSMMIDVCHCCGVAWLDPMACQQVGSMLTKQQNWISKLKLIFLFRKLDSIKDQVPCTDREVPRTPEPLLTTKRGNASFPHWDTLGV